ncbi:hypothetical protein ACP70R_033544 [Stipagrostis hirtigluma subsp. patula]
MTDHSNSSDPLHLLFEVSIAEILLCFTTTEADAAPFSDHAGCRASVALHPKTLCRMYVNSNADGGHHHNLINLPMYLPPSHRSCAGRELHQLSAGPAGSPQAAPGLAALDAQADGGLGHQEALPTATSARRGRAASLRAAAALPASPERRSKRRANSADEHTLERASRRAAIRNLEHVPGYFQNDSLDQVLERPPKGGRGQGDIYKRMPAVGSAGDAIFCNAWVEV